MLLWGWRRALVAFLAGAVLALALPPVDFPLVLFLTFPVLVWLLDGAIEANDRRRVRMIRPAFAIGWWFGFGYFLAGLYWIGFAFMVDAADFGWMMPFAVAALPAGLALFFGLGTALARMMWSDTPLRIFALAFGLGASEWLRGHVLSGFPWNLIGMALTVHDWPLQAASVFGIYGLTVIAVAIAAAPATLGDERPRVLPLALAIVAVAGLSGYGAYRLQQAGEAVLTGKTLRLVQPNIPQAEKWEPDNRARIFSDYLDLSSDKAGGTGRVDAVVWPESAVPFFLAREPGALSAIAEVLPFGRMLITGSNRVETSEGAEPRFFNSAYVIDDAGTIQARYDKMWLVPFGEIMPFERVLGALGIRKLVTLPGSFIAGQRPDLMDSPGLPRFRVLICYEAIFSGDIVDESDRPDWLLNITNDAWFGNSSGPRQHFQQARVRAAEEGLPLVRVANTGISGLIDPYGRVADRISLDTRGAIDVALPASLPKTLFARYGLTVLAGLLGFSLFAAILGRATTKRRQK